MTKSDKAELQEKAWRACKGAVNYLWQAHASWCFKEPVDEVKHKAPGYYALIKDPQDLQTIKSRLDGNKDYKSPHEVDAAVRQMCQNAKLYTPDEQHDVHRAANTLLELWTEQWRRREIAEYWEAAQDPGSRAAAAVTARRGGSGQHLDQQPQQPPPPPPATTAAAAPVPPVRFHIRMRGQLPGQNSLRRAPSGPQSQDPGSAGGAAATAAGALPPPPAAVAARMQRPRSGSQPPDPPSKEPQDQTPQDSGDDQQREPARGVQAERPALPRNGSAAAPAPRPPVDGRLQPPANQPLRALDDVQGGGQQERLPLHEPPPAPVPASLLRPLSGARHQQQQQPPNAGELVNTGTEPPLANPRPPQRPPLADPLKEFKRQQQNEKRRLRRQKQREERLALAGPSAEQHQGEERYQQRVQAVGGWRPESSEGWQEARRKMPLSVYRPPMTPGRILRLPPRGKVSPDSSPLPLLLSLLRAATWLPHLFLTCGCRRAQLLGGRSSDPELILVRCLCPECAADPLPGYMPLLHFCMHALGPEQEALGLQEVPSPKRRTPQAPSPAAEPATAAAGGAAAAAPQATEAGVNAATAAPGAVAAAPLPLAVRVTTDSTAVVSSGEGGQGAGAGEADDTSGAVAATGGSAASAVPDVSAAADGAPGGSCVDAGNAAEDQDVEMADGDVTPATAPGGDVTPVSGPGEGTPGPVAASTGAKNHSGSAPDATQGDAVPSGAVAMDIETGDGAASEPDNAAGAGAAEAAPAASAAAAADGDAVPTATGSPPTAAVSAVAASPARDAVMAAEAEAASVPAGDTAPVVAHDAVAADAPGTAAVAADVEMEDRSAVAADRHAEGEDGAAATDATAAVTPAPDAAGGLVGSGGSADGKVEGTAAKQPGPAQQEAAAPPTASPRATPAAESQAGEAGPGQAGAVAAGQSAATASPQATPAAEPTPPAVAGQSGARATEAQTGEAVGEVESGSGGRDRSPEVGVADFEGLKRRLWAELRCGRTVATASEMPYLDAVRRQVEAAGGASLVGRRVWVYHFSEFMLPPFDQYGTWRPAYVTSYFPESAEHELRYDADPAGACELVHLPVNFVHFGEAKPPTGVPPTGPSGVVSCLMSDAQLYFEPSEGEALAAPPGATGPGPVPLRPSLAPPPLAPRMQHQQQPHRMQSMAEAMAAAAAAAAAGPGASTAHLLSLGRTAQGGGGGGAAAAAAADVIVIDDDDEAPSSAGTTTATDATGSGLPPPFAQRWATAAAQAPIHVRHSYPPSGLTQQAQQQAPQHHHFPSHAPYVRPNLPAQPTPQPQSHPPQYPLQQQQQQQQRYGPSTAPSAVPRTGQAYVSGAAAAAGHRQDTPAAAAVTSGAAAPGYAPVQTALYQLPRGGPSGAVLSHPLPASPPPAPTRPPVTTGAGRGGGAAGAGAAAGVRAPPEQQQHAAVAPSLLLHGVIEPVYPNEERNLRMDNKVRMTALRYVMTPEQQARYEERPEERRAVVEEVVQLIQKTPHLEQMVLGLLPQLKLKVVTEYRTALKQQQQLQQQHKQQQQHHQQQHQHQQQLQAAAAAAGAGQQPPQQPQQHHPSSNAPTQQQLAARSSWPPAASHNPHHQHLPQQQQLAAAPNTAAPSGTAPSSGAPAVPTAYDSATHRTAAVAAAAVTTAAAAQRYGHPHHQHQQAQTVEALHRQYQLQQQQQLQARAHSHAQAQGQGYAQAQAQMVTSPPLQQQQQQQLAGAGAYTAQPHPHSHPQQSQRQAGAAPSYPASGQMYCGQPYNQGQVYPHSHSPGNAPGPGHGTGRPPTVTTTGSGTAAGSGQGVAPGQPPAAHPQVLSVRTSQPGPLSSGGGLPAVGSATSLDSPVAAQQVNKRPRLDSTGALAPTQGATTSVSGQQLQGRPSESGPPAPYPHPTHPHPAAHHPPGVLQFPDSAPTQPPLPQPPPNPYLQQQHCSPHAGVTAGGATAASSGGRGSVSGCAGEESAGGGMASAPGMASAARDGLSAGGAGGGGSGGRFRPLPSDLRDVLEITGLLMELADQVHLSAEQGKALRKALRVLQAHGKERLIQLTYITICRAAKNEDEEEIRDCFDDLRKEAARCQADVVKVNV